MTLINFSRGFILYLIRKYGAGETLAQAIKKESNK